MTHRGDPSRRTEANRLALRAAARILGAAHDFEFEVEGTKCSVSVQREATRAWPISADRGLTEAVDGPWPSAVTMRFGWATGSVVLQLDVPWWGNLSGQKHLVSIRVTEVSQRREILWITLALAFQDAGDSGEVKLAGSFVPARRRKDPPSDGTFPAAHAARDVVVRAGLPLASPFRVDVGRVRLPAAELTPSASEVFERIARLALIKVPFFLRDGDEGVEGEPPFVAVVDARSPAAVEPIAADGRRAGLWPLPGGVRHYKDTFDMLVQRLAAGPMNVDEFFALLQERFDVSGATARKGYLNLLLALGVASLDDDDILTISQLGLGYIAAPSADKVFEMLDATYVGVLEVLVLCDVLERAESEQLSRLLKALLGVEWETPNQVSFRRNWMLSLGLTERSGDGDGVTDFGRAVLERHPERVARLRAKTEELIDVLRPEAQGDAPELDESAIVGPGLDLPQPRPDGEPSGWSADRVDLTAAQLLPLARDLVLPPATLSAVVAALSAGKHVLLVGPPGTGKTELAHAVVNAAAQEGYCAGALVATASADWTTFDTIGGYAMKRSGELTFRPGAFLRAIEKWKWLIIDELNRADVDRAFGEMMTVLAGRRADTGYELDGGRHVSIGPEPDASHPVPRTFRVIATMNTWDKTSLFRLSYAVQRRFAIVHVSVPNDADLEPLVRRHAQQEGLDPPLEPEVGALLANLFSSRELGALRPLGPAVILDFVRYVRRRASGEASEVGIAIAEGVSMYLLPQLEGLEAGPAASARQVLLGTVRGRGADAARAELSLRFAEQFPHVKFPE